MGGRGGCSLKRTVSFFIIIFLFNAQFNFPCEIDCRSLMCFFFCFEIEVDLLFFSSFFSHSHTHTHLIFDVSVCFSWEEKIFSCLRNSRLKHPRVCSIFLRLKWPQEGKISDSASERRTYARIRAQKNKTLSNVRIFFVIIVSYANECIKSENFLFGYMGSYGMDIVFSTPIVACLIRNLLYLSWHIQHGQQKNSHNQQQY